MTNLLKRQLFDEISTAQKRKNFFRQKFNETRVFVVNFKTHFVFIVVNCCLLDALSQIFKSWTKYFNRIYHQVVVTFYSSFFILRLDKKKIFNAKHLMFSITNALWQNLEQIANIGVRN